jgi:hypothetical protein
MIKMIRSITKTDIGFIIFLLAILAIGTNSVIKRRNLKDNSKYTVGITTRVTYNRFGDPSIYYRYSVDREEFVVSHILNNEDVKKGQQYYVVFQLDNPKNSRLLTDKPVVGEIDTIPLNGWDEIPH